MNSPVFPSPEWMSWRILKGEWRANHFTHYHCTSFSFSYRIWRDLDHPLNPWITWSTVELWITPAATLALPTSASSSTRYSSCLKKIKVRHWRRGLGVAPNWEIPAFCSGVYKDQLLLVLPLPPFLDFLFWLVKESSDFLPHGVVHQQACINRPEIS